MKVSDKEILLKDICTRLPYGIKVLYNGINCVIENIGRDGSISLISDDSTHKKAIYLTSIEYIKPYLRPMSRMTEQERNEFQNLCNEILFGCIFTSDRFDWLNAHYFDYRGLIEKGFGLEAPEDMYKEEQNETRRKKSG